jgi:hypothetical protein
MEDVPDLAPELLQVGVGDAQVLLAEFADHRDHLLVVSAPGRALRSELLQRRTADQHVDRLAALEQVGDQELTDEARRAGDEVRHDLPPCE